MKIFNQLKSIPKLPTPEHLKVSIRTKWDEVPRDRVLYVHYHADDGLPYYVGYGEPDRPVSLSGRNGDWHTVSEKHGRTVEVKLTDLHEHVAIIIEKWWIYSYRQKFGRYGAEYGNGLMVNRSSGGHGASGSKRNEEQLEKLIAAKNRPEVKAKLSASLKIAANRPEVKAKKIAAQKIAQNRPEVKAKLSASAKIAQNRPEVKAKLSAAKSGELNPMYGRTGELNPMYGKKHPEESRTKLRGELNPMYGRTGEQCSSFKGFSVGINAEQFVILSGNKEIKECEFVQGNISACISGRLKSHKGFTWTRRTILNPEDFAGLEPFNELSAERLNAAKSE